MYMLVHVCVCMCVYVYMCVCVYMYVRLYVYKCKYVYYYHIYIYTIIVYFLCLKDYTNIMTNYHSLSLNFFFISNAFSLYLCSYP